MGDLDGGADGSREDGKLTIDTTPPSTSSSSSPTPTTPTTTPISHKFQPGDHVIRWEMLPIAWPIQIHGIVLSVNETTVVLVDFGLAAATAAPSSSKGAPSSSTPPTMDETAGVTLKANTPRLEDIHLGGVEEHKEEPDDEDDDEDDNGEGEETKTIETEPPSPREPMTTTTKKASWFSADPKEMEIARKAWMEKSARNSKKIVSSLQKMHPTHKQRLNLLVLDDPAEWKKWKKVNYDKGLFGFGGGGADNNNDDNENENHNGENGDDADDDGEAASPSGKSKWWSKMNPLKKSTHEAAAASTEVTPDVESKQQPQPAAGDKEGMTTMKQKWWQQRPATTEGEAETATTDDASARGDDTGDHSPTKASTSPDGKSWWKKMTKSFESGEAGSTTTSTNEEDLKSTAVVEAPTRTTTEDETTTQSEAVQQGEAAAVAATPVMNPAMAKLMNQRKEETEKEAASSSSNKLTDLLTKGLFGKKSSTGTAGSTPADEKDAYASGETTAASKKKLDLPTADPPKLVLARTRWLLKHGESVLPPYHAFHSNSECIAVFCKTGYWRNIQADVFLHSTAIGNAKTMGVATMGVAASVPLLAPVIAGLGIGMVAAPWLVLSSAKKQATDITQKMTDQFWAQAEPEVFLECIEHWSKLDEYYAKQQQQKLNGSTVPNDEASDEKSQDESNDIVKETDNGQVEQ